MAKKNLDMPFEYFKREEFYITGKHKEYVDQLWKLNDIQHSFFARLVDLYAIAAMVGFKAKRKAKQDGGTDDKRTIQLPQIISNYQTFLPIMKLILMMDESEGLPIEERMDRAFRTPESQEVYDANMELFNSYARGGIEVLYEELVLRADLKYQHDDERINKVLSLLDNAFELE